MFMRHVLIEFHVEDFTIPYSNVRSVRMIHLLHLSRDEYAAICRVEFRPNASTGFDPTPLTSTKVQVLSREPDGSAIVYLRGKPIRWLSRRLAPIVRRSGAYMNGVFELTEASLTAAFLGSASQIRRLLRGLVRSKVIHRVESLKDARFSLDSPLASLTEKQRQVLVTAYSQGYYSVPRKIGFDGLSRSLGLGRTTLNVHLRKAESRLISAVLTGTRGGNRRN